MAQRFTPVQVPEGLEDVHSFLTFIRDPEATGQAIQYVEDLKALLEEVNGRIALVGKAEEIEALRAQTGIDAAAAAKKLREADEQAAQIIAGARAANEADRQRWEEQWRDLAQRKAAHEAQVSAARAEVAAARKEAADAKAEAASAQVAADAAMAAAKERQAEYDRRMAAFKALAG